MGSQYLDATRQQDLDELAEAVVAEHLGGREVDPLMVLKARRISFSANDYGSAFDGLLEHRAGRFHVYCNLNRCGSVDDPRGRFTLAHELGHYFIDGHRRGLEKGIPPHPSSTGFASRNYAEREADWFAGALLMPRTRFLRTAKRTTSLVGILDLAKAFRVSAQAACLRFANLEISPCVVLYWRGNEVVWRGISKAFLEGRYLKTIDDQSQVPHDAATGKILAGAGATGTVVDRGTTASAWFPLVGRETARNIILIEHAMSLGSYGALTVLFPATGEPLR